MTTLKKIAANRRNAQLSTGPVTPEGKAKTALNALVHGFSSPVEATLRDDEARRAFAEFRQTFIGILKPATELEWNQVERMVRARWQMNRVARFEGCVTEVEQLRLAVEHDDFRELPARERSAVVCLSLGMAGRGSAPWERHESRFRHQFERAVAELARLQGIRMRDEGTGSRELLAA